MDRLKVSVILPFAKETDGLKATIESMLSQTCQEMELLLIPYGDGAVSLPNDNRICCLTPCANGGAAANLGLEQAQGDYVLVLKPGDTGARDLLERAQARAVETKADVTVFCGYSLSRVGAQKKDETDGFDPKLVQNASAVISRDDYPGCFLSILKGDLSFRLTRTAFLREKQIRFAELDSQWQLPFCALCDAQAGAIALMDRRMLTTSAPETCTDARNVLAAADLVAEALNAQPHTRQAGLRLLVEYTTAAFRRSTADFGSEEARLLYTGLQTRYRAPFFDALDRSALTAKDRCFFDTILHTSYEEMLARCRVPMVVSFTSFPKRIGFTVNVIANVKAQTRRADKVLLYLAPEQFPRKEEELPQPLLDQVAQGLVEIKWVPDIRSHKKYHYVMQEFPDNLIVTLDDDLAYPDDMLENLFHCYLCHPNNISAMRAHLTVVDTAAGLLLPYNRWVKEYRSATYIPSPQLFVTSGAGTLFPPKVLHPLALELDKARSLCPYADDVWLNLMALLNGRSVVLAVDDFTMKNMPGSQEEALQSINVDNNQNDVQYNKIRTWLKEEFGSDVIWNALTAGEPSVRCRTVMDLSDQYLALDSERKRIRNKLHQVWRDKVSREQDNDKLRREIQRLQQELAAERRSFRLLRKVRNGCRMIRGKGLKYTLSLGVNKVFGRFLK